VQNFHAVETEAAFRHREWQREIVAAELAAQVRVETRRPSWWLLPLRIQAGLRSLFALRLPLRLWATTAEGQCAPHPWQDRAAPL
jgi:hypothetical protein